MGEIAPTYFASTLARERIAQLIPQSRVICIFRNPVDRLLSLYRLKRAYGEISWNFEEAAERDRELIENKHLHRYFQGEAKGARQRSSHGHRVLRGLISGGPWRSGRKDHAPSRN
jgi:hypothetical protein